MRPHVVGIPARGFGTAKNSEGRKSGRNRSWEGNEDYEGNEEYEGNEGNEGIGEEDTGTIKHSR